MRYRVRTPHGELEYESILHVEQAYVAGLVDPEDELLEEGGTLWRKAGSFPNLVRARSAAPRLASRAQPYSVAVAVLLGAVSLVLLLRSAGKSVSGWIVGLIVVFLLTRVTLKVYQRKPHG